MIIKAFFNICSNLIINFHQHKLIFSENKNSLTNVLTQQLYTDIGFVAVAVVVMSFLWWLNRED
jgi:hypothetical protein